MYLTVPKSIKKYYLYFLIQRKSAYWKQALTTIYEHFGEEKKIKDPHSAYLLTDYINVGNTRQNFFII